MHLPQTFLHLHDAAPKHYLLATRPMFFAASVLPVLSGTALGYQLSGELDGLALCLALIAIILVNGGINVLNDVYDDINGTDRVNTDRVAPFTGGSRSIQDGILDRDQMRTWGVLLLLGALTTGVLLTWYKGWEVLFLGFAGIFLGVGYSLPPLQLGSRGMGETAVALGVGVLPVTGAAWLQTGNFTWVSLLLAVPVSLWVMNILLVNDIPDTQADASVGKRTLAVRLGVARAVSIYLAANIVAFIAVSMLALFGYVPTWTIVVPLVMLLPAFISAPAVRRWPEDKFGMRNAIRITIAIHVVNGLWLALWLGQT